jgi:Kef-type K+ transport system membrane component KefB
MMLLNITDFADLVRNQFYEFAAILIIAAAVGAIGRVMKQPLVVSFIAVGILVGPSALNLLSSDDQIHLLAEMGITILLFVVGLKLDLGLIKSMGKVALVTGLGQVVFTSVFGYLIGLALGFSHLVSLYVAVALTFSSTIIIVKLLSDKKEIDMLHGQVALGFLIVQDIVVVVVMIVLSALGVDSERPVAQDMVYVFGKGLAMLGVVALLMKYVLPKLVANLARAQELLVLFSIAWAIALAATGDYLGFSKEVGAFLGGISLASTQFREMISGRLVSVRDFLLLFFFINLGAELDLGLMGAQIIPSIIFSLFVLVGNPIIVLIIMGVMGYRSRTAFLAGLTVAQISEFSLILARMGLDLGHIDNDTLGLITLVGLITIGLSTYMIMYSGWLYEKLAPLLKVFERKNIKEKDLDQEHESIDAIIIGLGRYGSNLARRLRNEDLKILGVDFNPQLILAWQEEGLQAIYGDAEDPNLPEVLPLESTKVVISSFPDVNINRSLIKFLKSSGYEGRIALTAHSQRDGHLLEEAGADVVLYPFADAAQNIIDLFAADLEKED